MRVVVKTSEVTLGWGIGMSSTALYMRKAVGKTCRTDQSMLLVTIIFGRRSYGRTSRNLLSQFVGFSKVPRTATRGRVFCDMDSMRATATLYEVQAIVQAH